MDYKRLIQVQGHSEAQDIVKLLTTHGIPAQVMECPHPDYCETAGFIVLVYEADYMRAQYVMEEI